MSKIMLIYSVLRNVPFFVSHPPQTPLLLSQAATYVILALCKPSEGNSSGNVNWTGGQ